MKEQIKEKTKRKQSDTINILDFKNKWKTQKKKEC